MARSIVPVPCRLARQLDCEASTFPRYVAYANLASVFRDDSVTNAEAEAGALSNWLGRVERIEYARSILHAGAAIGELRYKLPIFMGGAYPQVAVGRCLQNGVNRVVYEIQEDLLELMRIGHR